MRLFNFLIFKPVSSILLFTTQSRKAIVSVINDLATDQRVQRSCSVLQENGYEVLMVGRKLKHSPSVAHLPWATKRMNLLFTSGPLFYFFFNLRLFFVLLFKRCDLLYANDLDTLWPNYIVSKLKGIPLIYDSHEIFCEVPELQHTPAKKRIWEKLEASIVPKLKYCITVNESIGSYFNKKYGADFKVVRNIPNAVHLKKSKSRAELGMPQDKHILIYQGSGINIQRGAEELLEAMQYVDNTHLFIIGGGDVFPVLKQMREQLKLHSKVTILDKIPKEELFQFTTNADLGISIDKDTNLNYHFSLPNKVFDYIQAGIPVLASRLPEIEKLVLKYHIGDFIESHEPKHIAKKIQDILSSPDYAQIRTNTFAAEQDNCWEEEKKTLSTLIKSIQR